MHGWARWRQGDGAGRDEMLEGIANHRDWPNNKFGQPLFDALWADVEADRDPAAGVAAIDAAIADAVALGQAWFDAELHRRRGTYLLRCAEAREAESAFLQALALARAQQTRSFELRAALDLACLYRDTGRDREARDLLAPALVGFSETPELPEVAGAQRLLAELGGHAERP